MEHTSTEHKAGRVLMAGIWVSGVLMSLGLVLALARGMGPGDAPAGPTIGTIVRFAVAEPLHPLTFLYGGILVLMFTPVLRVITALIGFAEERDRRFVLVSGTVLLLLLCEVAYSLFLK